MSTPHLPVLLNEVLEVFEGASISIFFDGTVGAGGHAEAVLKAHPEIERYIACDRDPSALEEAKKRLSEWGDKIVWVQSSFGKLDSILDEIGVKSIDALLVDLGVSSMQLDRQERGFSFRMDGPLDMRMDPSQALTAEVIVNEFSEEKIAQILFEYGEEFRSRQAAKAIVMARRKRAIRTTFELIDVLKGVLRKGKIHPATKVFQALRIAVNDELGEIKGVLSKAIERLSLKGRLAVISFHSLEDRIVKWAFRNDERLKILTKKPKVASREEVRTNGRARSAKLRAAEKL